MTQTVIRIGNSDGIIIPNDLKKQLGIKKGSKVYIEKLADNKSFIVSMDAPSKSVTSVTPNFLSILERVNSRYGSALKELAGK